MICARLQKYLSLIIMIIFAYKTSYIYYVEQGNGDGGYDFFGKYKDYNLYIEVKDYNRKRFFSLQLESLSERWNKIQNQRSRSLSYQNDPFTRRML